MKQLVKKIYRTLIPERLRTKLTPWLYELRYPKKDLFCMLQKPARKNRKPFHTPLRVSFIGPWNYSLGLGIASKGYLDALKQSNIELNAYGISVPLHTHPRSTDTVSMVSFEGPTDVYLIHLHPDLWQGCFVEQNIQSIQESSLRIGIWVWETSVIPVQWKDAIKCIDEIWTPSQYCAAIFEKETGLPVKVITHVIPLPELDKIPEARLKRWDSLLVGTNFSPSSSRIILFTFDSMNILSRKNPYALVRAFKASGLSSKGWVLVLKTKNLFEYPDAGNLLVSEINHDPAIMLINKSITPDELEQLFLGCDIYASPHSSEGFGLTIAEAMAAGKHVVATDFGGSTDFLSEKTGYPVKYQLTTVGNENSTLYANEGVWATVDEQDLSDKLQQAASDVEQGNRERANNARQFIAEHFSEAAVSKCLERALDGLRSPPSL